MTKKRVVVGMSGGVDSSLAAALLKEEGFEVVGLFMRNWHEKDDTGLCTADDDFADVRDVCNKLDIPYYSVDFADEYYERVFKLFLDEYALGRTPNPDVLCNREIKFGAFLKHALSFGADYVATGHYAALRRGEHGGNFLLRAKDEGKDQTYFLNQVDARRFDKVLFPLGEMMKSDVRRLSEELGLSVARKKDSTGICFIGERNFRNFLARYIPMREGDIVDARGRTVGRHRGVFYYTPGQRKGLGIGGVAGDGGEGAWFVTAKDVNKNILYVTRGDETPLYRSAVDCDGFNFIPERHLTGQVECTCRFRHRQQLFPATARFEGDCAHIEFAAPQRAPVEGQYAVLYVGRECLGGGVIQKTYR